MSDFSLVIWSSDPQETEGLAIPSLVPPWQQGEHTVEVITVPPAARARNIGQVYTAAGKMARFPIKIYAHQDIVMEDRQFLTKLSGMIEADPRIGVVGIVGATIDTGGGFFHAPTAYKRGESPEQRAEVDPPTAFFRRVHDLTTTWVTRFNPERAEVALVDCLLFASPLDLPFATCYHKTHMAAEDYCMRVRSKGYTVWTLDSLMKHFSTGTLDYHYWESVRTFRRKWRHMLPPELPSVQTLRKFQGDLTRNDPSWDSVWANIEIKEAVTR